MQTIAFLADQLAIRKGPARGNAGSAPRRRASDRQERLHLHDERTFTLWARGLNYYATVPASPTIADLADRLDEKQIRHGHRITCQRCGSPWCQAQFVGTTTSCVVVGADARGRQRALRQAELFGSKGRLESRASVTFRAGETLGRDPAR